MSCRMIDPSERKTHYEQLESDTVSGTSANEGAETILQGRRNPDRSSARRVCSSCGKEYDDGGLTRCPVDGAFLAVLDDSVAGTTLEKRFELQVLLGKGGMGSVYKARDLSMKRDVAVKFLHKHLISDPQTIHRFQQEARAASALSHGNVVVAHDFGVTEDGIPYLVLEYLEGSTLAQEISSDSTFDLQRFLRVFTQICDGLAAAHERGVVHRDIKPGNIMLSRAGTDAEHARIMDFGIAKIFPHEEDTLQRLTRTGEIFGSPFYMSPEQVQGARLDARSDIYSLGCVMYETLTGNPPHFGATAFETLTKHLHDAPKGIADARSDIASIKRLEQIVLKTLAKNPSERYDTVSELKEDLDRLSRGELLKHESRLPTAPGRLSVLPRWLPLEIIASAGVPVIVFGSMAIIGGFALNAAQHTSALQKPFLLIAFTMIAFGFTFFMLVLKLFGPGGTLHRISLESYVPHQFQQAQLEILKKLIGEWQPGALTLGVFKRYVAEMIPVRRMLTLSAREREQQKHVVLIGKAGMGKTTLMRSFALEEVRSDKAALIVLDFSGDLYQQLRQHASDSAGSPVSSKERYYFADLSDPNCQLSLSPQDLLGRLNDPIACKSAACVMASTIASGDPNERMPDSSFEFLQFVLELVYSRDRSLLDLPALLRSPHEMRQLIEEAKDDPRLNDLCQTWKLYDSVLATDEWSEMISPIVARTEAMMRDSRLRKLLCGQGSDKLSLREAIAQHRVVVLKISRDHFTTKANKPSSVFLFSLIETLKALPEESSASRNSCSLFMDMIDKVVSPEILEHLIRKDSRFNLFTFSSMRSMQEFDQSFRERLLQQASLLCVFSPNLQDAELLAPIMFRLGMRVKSKQITEFFDKPDTPLQAPDTPQLAPENQPLSPGFEFVRDAPRLNVDRLIAQDPGSYFGYVIGTVAGVFKMTVPHVPQAIDASGTLLPGSDEAK